MRVVISIVFVLTRLSGNPVHLLLDVNATQRDFDLLTRHLGLDKPLPVQYGLYVKNIVQGDFGKSVLSRRPVIEHIRDRLPATVELGMVAMFLSVLIGVPIGVYSAVRRGGVLDSAARVFAVLGQSLPPFWLGLMLILLFGVILGVAGRRPRWSPASPAARLYAGLFYLCRHHAPDALQHAGGTGGGLHQIRPTQGTPRADRALETRFEERLAAGDHLRGAAVCAISGWCCGDRDRVRLAGPGTPYPREYHNTRLPYRAGRRAGVECALPHRESTCRHALQLAQPENPLSQYGGLNRLLPARRSVLPMWRCDDGDCLPSRRQRPY